MTDYTVTLDEFVKALASPSPAPGGGGAAGLVGAVGTALCSMVGSLTTGKKKYADVEPVVQSLLEECRTLQALQLKSISDDAEGFLPLADAYKIPKDAPDRDDVLEKATMGAIAVPMQIMELACKGIELSEKMAEIGTPLAVSDAGGAVIILKASLQTAYLSVLINTRMLKKRDDALSINAKAEKMVNDYGAKADAIYNKIRNSLLS